MSQAEEIVQALGAMSEMAHTVYRTMILAGADRIEALEAMKAWIASYWHEAMSANRQKPQDDQND